MNVAVGRTTESKPQRRGRLSKSDQVFHHVAEGSSRTPKRKVVARATTAEKVIPFDDDEDGFEQFNN
jgi:hypothetical protein